VTPRSVKTLTWVNLALLAILLIAWPANALQSKGIWLGLALAAPLLLPAWGLARDKPRALQGGILLQALYLAIGLTEVIANQAARPWAAATLLLSMLCCAGLLAVLRLPRGA
jgi:uncharacterized membrane protein